MIDRERFRADPGPGSISYGPVWTDGSDPEQWVLLVATDEGERIEIVLDEHPMYELWTEVQGVPWPNPDRSMQDRLFRQVVHAASGADEEMLQDALETLGVGRDV